MQPYITVTKGMSGYFAVEMREMIIDGEHTGLPEPYETGMGRYATYEDAEQEAQAWAVAESLPFK